MLFRSDQAQVSSHLIHLNARRAAALRRRLDSAQRELSLVTTRRAFRYPEEIITMREQRLDDACGDLKEVMNDCVVAMSQRLEHAQAKLHALSPLGVLKRGYAVIRKMPDDRIVKSVHELAVGDKAKVVFADGEASVEVEEVKERS